MQIRKLGLIVLFLILVISARAQTTRDVAAPTPPKAVYRAEKDSKFRLFKKEETKDQEVAEFRKRMKNVSKKKKKEARLALKPQYSDPSYFGHKKPPKKRSNGKKKFCKECGLTH